VVLDDLAAGGGIRLACFRHALAGCRLYLVVSSCLCSGGRVPAPGHRIEEITMEGKNPREGCAALVLRPTTSAGLA